LLTFTIWPFSTSIRLPFLSLVLKQQKSILLRQRLVGLDKTDNLLLFLFGQTHVVTFCRYPVLPFFRSSFLMSFKTNR
jgi:hypothetical protein